MISTLDEAVEALYDLSVGIIGHGAERHERPHKPLLLLAVLDLIANGQATPARIPWSRELRARFAAYFPIVRSHDDQCTPQNPFVYLRQDGFWQPLRLEQQGVVPLHSTPTAGDAALGAVFAKLCGGLENFVLSPGTRLRLRLALVARYFPRSRAALIPLFADGESVIGEGARVREDEAETPGRNPAFRRKILEIYDCQCAACGLRIKMPAVRDLTFVDAAHLIHFEEEPNDNPTNGIALCKNHHWAMDRFLIAPCWIDDRTSVWRASPLLDARRSKGEEELLALHERRLLTPKEEAFKPDRRSIEWRCQRLVG